MVLSVLESVQFSSRVTFSMDRMSTEEYGGERRSLVMSLWYMIVAHEIEARCIVLGEQKRREMRTERGNKK